MSIVMLAGFSAKAESYKVELDGVKYTIDTREEFNYAYVTGPVDRDQASITIAEAVTYDNVEYPVRLVGMSAFNGCSNLTSVTLPASLKWIDKFAFHNTGISTVTIPVGVESIGLSAFADCAKLENVNMLGGGDLDNFVFGNCPLLTEFTFPANIGEVSPLVFRGSKNLKSIKISDESTRYSSKDGMLYSKDGKELKIYPWGKGLEPEIPEGVTAIGPRAFYQAPIQWIDMPESLLTIGEEAFYSCTGMDELEIGVNVKEIGQAAFQMCSQLTKVTFPESLESIGISAFSSCSKIKSIVIPDNVTTLGNMVFDFCTGLESVRIGAGIGELPYGAFSYCSSLTQVEFSEGLKKIGSNSFSSCSKLTSLTLPDSVEDIDETAFWSCYTLAEIHFGTGLKTMGELVFLGVTSLKDIYVSAKEPPTAKENTFATYEATLHVPAESLKSYQDDAVWGKFTTIEQMVPSSVTDVIGNSDSTKYIYRIDGTFVKVISGDVKQEINNLPSGVYVIADGMNRIKIAK